MDRTVIAVTLTGAEVRALRMALDAGMTRTEDLARDSRAIAESVPGRDDLVRQRDREVDAMLDLHRKLMLP